MERQMADVGTSYDDRLQRISRGSAVSLNQRMQGWLACRLVSGAGCKFPLIEFWQPWKPGISPTWRAEQDHQKSFAALSECLKTQSMWQEKFNLDS